LIYKINIAGWKCVAVGACVSGYLGASAVALAAGVVVPETVQPGRSNAAPAPVPQSTFDFTIDQPRGTKDTRALSTLKFTVSSIVVDGAVTLDKDEVEAITQPLIGKSVTLADLSKAAEDIENAYHAKGYLLTRALVPAQKTHDGVFHIKVIEGSIAAVVVSGARAGSQQAIETLAAPMLAQHPLQNPAIERSLLLANDLPGVVAAGTLEPGAAEGTSTLNVAVQEPLMQGSASIDNRTSVYSGPWEDNASVSFNSPFHYGEQVTVYGSDTLPRITGSASAGSHVVVPFGDGWSATSAVDYSYGAPGYSLSHLAIRTTSLSGGETVSYAYLRSRALNLSFSGGLTWHESNTSALGAALSADRWTTLVGTATWSENGHFMNGATSGTVGVSQGMPIGASALNNGNLSRVGANPLATKFTATAQRTQPLTGPYSLMVGFESQYALTKVMAGEEFGLGGSTFGRGFDPSVISADNGIGTTVELRYDIDSFDETTAKLLQSVQLFVFNDWGGVNTAGTESGYPSKIESAGLGARINGVQGWSGTVDVDDVLVGPADSRGGRGVRVFAGVSKAF